MKIPINPHYKVEIEIIGRHKCSLSSDVAQWQNNTSYIKPFKANTLILYYQWISGHQPEKILRTYFEYNMRKRKCDFVTVMTDLTEPNTAIKSSIVDYFLAQKSVGASEDTAVKRGPKDGHRIQPRG